MIYADHAATSPPRREVLEAMWPVLAQLAANPSSVHEPGLAAAALLEEARAAIAVELGARAAEIVLTSGGTEADNLAVKGIVLASSRGRHVVTTAGEHEAVLASADYLVRHHGAEVTVLGLDSDGLVDAGELAAALRPDTALVSVHHASNELGTVQPMAEIARAARAAGVPLHSDAVQSAGWLGPRLRDPGALGADALSVSGHKLGAPAGVGVLAIRQAVPLEPLVHGGGQERGRRSGTESVAGAVAMAAALQLAGRERASREPSVRAARDALVGGVRVALPAARLTGHPERRLPDHASFVVPGVSGEAVLLELERAGVVASSGSACAAGRDEPSPALLAIGLDDDEARSSIRLTLGRAADAALGVRLARELAEAVARVSPR
ncbi:cysteine desulfurase family protein [Homoserinibacter sp. YIM 151385]|uniref:cysteine desulfurase family protein n=1 Tax=Homoserinibacter sp. YIM 151385 TaxID=2985506 RepID=UPI0022F008BB|nr:cysteine desulfurase family protein [Homoserinibacter sp. YIM 151385]WBU38418.1 cysteine desulfurase family protein [Homoserinibacter sp. YIM 151385]